MTSSRKLNYKITKYGEACYKAKLENISTYNWPVLGDNKGRGKNFCLVANICKC